MSRILYLAEPIDQAAMLPTATQRMAQDAATENGWSVYRPKYAWAPSTDGSGPARDLDAANRAVLSRAGAMIAFVPDGVPSIGVPREIEFAVGQGIPVLILRALGDVAALWALADLPQTQNREGVVRFLKEAEDREQNQGGVILPDARIELAGEFNAALAGGPSNYREGEEPIQYSVEQDQYAPQRVYQGDAGYDLFASEPMEVPPGEFRDIATGVRVVLPHGVWLQILGRSSTIRKYGLMVTQGIIDTGYRGELKIGVWNLGDDPVMLGRGVRLAQAIPMSNLATTVSIHRVTRDEFEQILSYDGRDESGFGSTS